MMTIQDKLERSDEARNDILVWLGQMNYNYI